MAKETTIQEAAELSFDKCGYAATCCLGLSDEGLEVVLDYSVEKCVLGCTALVFDGQGPSRGLRSGARCGWMWLYVESATFMPCRE
jgi:hypothetical protein